ncbi:indole-3-glycerol phosphate synthase TrpC [Paenibacillus thermotolerans]|uniref:indole-3-glycerol phosphate synthase TrpC n=1 Tax=Paenibacillus thermotolerans TaxID=3027807 RepID=UPI0023680FE3|nr:MULTISPECIES: indole-3-glycerol phosphate synthase TrpC [unclassified Paenibacillus]
MYLDRIVEVKKKEVAELREKTSIAELERAISVLPGTKGFHAALKDRKRPMGLIAEVKKASPSKGLIRPDFDPVEIAKAYEAAGADCLSVLTDAPHFQGANDYLSNVRKAVALPLLRKDFTIDPLQIYEARAIGADAVLLIAAILTKDELRRFMELASGLGLDTLLEVHDRAELETALELDAPLIGINNRNLHTFVTDVKVTEELARHIPEGKTVVSESGISRSEEIEYLRSVGAAAVLVGEHFMRQADIGAAVNELMGALVR